MIEFMTCFYFYLQELSSDSSQHVRSALASVIMGMAPVLGKVSSRVMVHVIIPKEREKNKNKIK